LLFTYVIYTMFNSINFPHWSKLTNNSVLPKHSHLAKIAVLSKDSRQQNVRPTEEILQIEYSFCAFISLWRDFFILNHYA
jgi:hypothetical protein